MRRKSISLILTLVMTITSLFTMLCLPSATVNAEVAQGIVADIYNFNRDELSLYADTTFETMDFTGEFVLDSKKDVVLKDVGVEGTTDIAPASLITAVVPRPDHINRFYVYAMRVIANADDVIECGVIIKRGATAETAADIKIGDDGVYQIKSSRQASMGEYAIVRKDDETRYSVRSYMKYTDANGVEQIVYSDAQTVELDIQ